MTASSNHKLPLHVGIAACGYNLLILVFNLGFTNRQNIANLNPNMMSPYGQLMIIVWGLTYLAAGLDYSQNNNSGSGGSGMVWWVFAIEKVCYAVGWIHWLQSQETHPLGLLSSEYAESGLSTQWLALLFHCIYGSGDAVFGLVFAYIGLGYSTGGPSDATKHD